MEIKKSPSGHWGNMVLIIYKWEALDRLEKMVTGRFQVSGEICENDALILVKQMNRQYENDNAFHFTLLEKIKELIK